MKSLHAWVTVVLVATSRKSISDYLVRCDTIEQAAKYLIEQYEELPAFQRNVIDETFVSRGHPNHYKLIPIHMETTVQFSYLVQSFVLLKEHFQCLVFPLELGLEMVYSFFMTNNSIRYYYFFQHYMAQGCPKDPPFIVQMQVFLYEKFGCWNGTKTRRELEYELTNKILKLQKKRNSQLKELKLLSREHTFLSDSKYGKGSERWMCTTTRAQLDNCTFQSLRKFKSTLLLFNHKYPESATISFKAYKALCNEVMDSLAGVGILISQKIVYACGMTGMIQNSGVLNYCIPGSSKHIYRLNKLGFKLYGLAQAQQVVQTMVKMTPHSFLKAEEIMCYNCKNKLERQSRQDVVFKDSSLFIVKYKKEHGICTVWRCMLGRPPTLFQPFQFCEDSLDYQPAWNSDVLLSEYNKGLLRMPGIANMMNKEVEAEKYSRKKASWKSCPLSNLA